MINKTSISKKKVVRFLIGAALVCLLGGLMFAASYMHRNSNVTDINVVLPGTDIQLMTKEAFKEILLSNELSNYENKKIKDLNLLDIEAVLENSPWIGRAEAYIDNNKMLQLEIYQNVPVARIFTQSGEHYFIDTARNVLPTNVILPVTIPVFTNVPQLSNDEQSEKYKSNIAYLGALIAADTFWNAQITQIQMLQNGTFEMMTLMGNQRIKFGDTVNAKSKLDNLFVFYNKALTKLGWDRYQVIDIRYNNQIVTSPAMGYIAPIITDTAVELPDLEAGETPVSHVPQVVVSNAPIQNTGNVAGTEADKNATESKPMVAASPSTPKKVELKIAAPKKVEAKKAEPKKAEPKKAEPKKTTPKKTEPKKELPKKAVPQKTAPKKTTETKQPKHLLPSKK